MKHTGRYTEYSRPAEKGRHAIAYLVPSFPDPALVIDMRDLLTSGFVAAVSLYFGIHYSSYLPSPFLPNLHADTPPSPDHPAKRAATQSLDEFFTTRFSKGDIDSLSVAVVTSIGSLYEGHFGVMRGNESATSPPTTRHLMYRIASVSKLFTVLEGLILEQRGVIRWGDPVDKYIQDFRYRLDGLDPNKPSVSRESTPMTMYQLATHTSGLGRDWPPGTVAEWPESLLGGGPPPTNGLPFPSHEALYAAIAKHHITSPPASYPAYSNTGTGLLGVVLEAASNVAAGDSFESSYVELLQRDVFGPMGLNGSHFLATEANKHLIVVPSLAPEVADQDFLDAMNPAGGQFSSLADMVTVTQTLLNANHPRSQLSHYSLNKWLQPVHTFEEDDWTEIGFIWEIIKAEDSNGRLRKIYWKLGAMAGYHAALAFHPGTGYGVVVLMGGHYPDAAKLAFEIVQPAIDKALADLAEELYTGTWRDSDVDLRQEDGGNASSSARAVVERGTLYVEEYTLLGVDALRKLGASGRLALRSSMRRDELRIDTGIPGYNGMKHTGCYPYWNGQDIWGVRNNAAINAIYLSGEGADRRLHVPSLDLILKKALSAHHVTNTVSGCVELRMSNSNMFRHGASTLVTLVIDGPT
ncbi:beta-lactamase/transpeptidase-like protein [Fomitopsis serialis]|uniref:beta-lactamase/transpeptidase-like protein n=1 Tax=Fomitopsis serialis TaxID=139415 RepID=UPI0020082D4D|nr:beta-lactamase/transpeptidase-like protein [Neoantrodia serialis]KAH9917603.1 beta-lactamase/transpeptidase-like protein [Neoantrodia serialis]